MNIVRNIAKKSRSPIIILKSTYSVPTDPRRLTDTSISRAHIFFGSLIAHFVAIVAGTCTFYEKEVVQLHCLLARPTAELSSVPDLLRTVDCLKRPLAVQLISSTRQEKKRTWEKGQATNRNSWKPLSRSQQDFFGLTIGALSTSSFIAQRLLWSERSLRAV